MHLLELNSGIANLKTMAVAEFHRLILAAAREVQQGENTIKIETADFVAEVDAISGAVIAEGRRIENLLHLEQIAKHFANLLGAAVPEALPASLSPTKALSTPVFVPPAPIEQDDAHA